MYKRGERAFVTVTGAPGVGKTVLTRVEWLCEFGTSTFPGGVAFVPLEDLRDAADLPKALARALSISENRPSDALRADLV